MDSLNTPIELILDNGLKIITLEAPQASGVTCRLGYKVSHRDETVKNAGINMALLQILELDNLNEQYTTSISDNYTALQISTNPDQLNQCFELFTKTMTSPVLSEKALQLSIKSNARHRAEKRYFMADDWIPIEFDSMRHSIGYQHWRLFTPDSASRIDITQLRQWHHRYYSSGNAFLIIVGNVKAEAVEMLAKQYFDSVLPRPTAPVLAVELRQPCAPDTHYVLHKVTSKPRLLIVPDMPGMRDALEDNSGAALSILSMILKHKLSSLPSVAHGICTYTQDKYVSLFKISVKASARDQSLVDLEADINKLINEIKFNMLPTEELKIAREQALASLANSDDHAGLALEIAGLEDCRIPFSQLEQRRKDLLNVTPQDIQRVTSTYFSPKRTIVVHILPMQTPSLATTTELTLCNGLKIITLELPRSTDVVCSLNFKVGSRDESVNNSGINTLLTEILFTDKNFVVSENFKILNSGDFTRWIDTVKPGELNSYFKNLDTIMSTPALTQASMTHEIQCELQYREQIRSSSSSCLNCDEFEALAYPVSGYGNPSLTADSARNIDLKQIQQWQQNYYSPGNACLVIVGNVKAGAIEALAQQYFGAVPFRKTASTQKVKELCEPGKRHITLHMNTPKPKLSVAFNVPGLVEAVTEESNAPLQILCALFEQNYKSLLVASDGKCDFVQRKHAGLFSISVTANSVDQSLEQLEADLIELIEGFKLNGAPPEDIDSARERAIAKILEREIDDEEIAFDLSLLEDGQVPFTYLDQRHNQLLETTAEEIQRAACTYFTPERMTVAHILPMQAPMQ